MRERVFSRSAASRLDRAIEGQGIIDAETAPLLAVVTRLQSAAGTPVPGPSNVAEARMKMLRAVGEQAAVQAHGSHGAKVRGATLGAAAVAGAGLLMASAATNSSPIGIVRSTVLEFPAMVAGSAAPELEANVTVVGTIVSIDEAAGEVHVDTGATRAAVDVRSVSPGATAVELAPAATVGSVVEVDGSVREGEATVRARAVRVKEPATASIVGPVVRPSVKDRLPTATPTAEVRPALALDADVTTNLAPPTPAPSLAVEVDVSVDAPAALTTATPRPTLTPTPTPTPSPDVKQEPTAIAEPTSTTTANDGTADSSNLEESRDESEGENLSVGLAVD